MDRVSGGDTLVAVSSSGTKFRIRPLGIDAPEIPHGNKPGQPFGEEAWDYLDHVIGGKTIQVDANGPDRYKRIPAVVWDGQINVNLLMVAMGYAEVYRGAPCQVYCRELEQAEAKARHDRVGMWSQATLWSCERAYLLTLGSAPRPDQDGQAEWRSTNGRAGGRPRGSALPRARGRNVAPQNAAGGRSRGSRPR